ncbi:hypothetical protein FRC17_000726, partial [Serendipita sp. 399]
MYADHVEGNDILQDWKTIRLVCRAWRSLVGPQPHRKIKSALSDSVLPTKLKGISSIFVDDASNAELVLRGILQRPVLSSHLTTIFFGNDRPWRGLDILLDNPSSFPNIRCLSVVAPRERSTFWQDLQDAYPKLVSLTVLDYTPHTT